MIGSIEKKNQYLSFIVKKKLKCCVKKWEDRNRLLEGNNIKKNAVVGPLINWLLPLMIRVFNFCFALVQPQGLNSCDSQ